MLKGCIGADIFVFRQGGGGDTVTDFNGADFLRLDRGLWAEDPDLTAAEVLASFATIDGGNTVLTFASGESITLTGFIALVATDLQLV
jgi:hypothetical protein